MWNNSTFLFTVFAIVDIETNRREQGKYAHLLEVGIVFSDGFKIIDEYQTLIQSPLAVCSYITELTGIHDEMLVDAPSLSELAPTIFEKLNGSLFVAHNVGFDYGHLKFHLSTLGIQLKLDRLCTFKTAKKLYPQIGSYGLAHLCKEFHLNLKRHHRALDDARATAELLHMMIQDFGMDHILTLADRRMQIQQLPPLISHNEIDLIPEIAGVLWVWDEQGKLLMVKSLKDMYKGFIESHQSYSKKNYNVWMAAQKVVYKQIPSSILGRLLMTHSLWLHKPLLQRVQKIEFAKDEIEDGEYYGISSTGAEICITITENSVSQWEWLGHDVGLLHPPLPIPAFIRKSISTGTLKKNTIPRDPPA